jgi:DNA-binding transcriptional LysR family regulator
MLSSSAVYFCIGTRVATAPIISLLRFARNWNGAYAHLNQVQYFQAICKYNNFTLAAKRCGVTQPTISMGIKRLEARLGAALFVRQPRLALTPFGRALRPEMDHLAQSYEGLLRSAKRFLDRG